MLEASERGGGVIRTVRREGFLLELGPNTVRPTPEIWALIAELGLEGEVLLSDPRLPRFVELEGALPPLPMSPPTFFSTLLLSTRGKLRLLAEPLVRSRKIPARPSAPSSRGAWEGRPRTDHSPLVSGIWAGDPDRLLATAAFPALTEWEREHGSLLRGALAARRFCTGSDNGGAPLLREGLETLPRALARELGDRLTTGAASSRSRPKGPLDRAHRSGGPPADRVILAADSNEAARLIAPFEPEAARALRQVPPPLWRWSTRLAGRRRLPAAARLRTPRRAGGGAPGSGASGARASFRNGRPTVRSS